MTTQEQKNKRNTTEPLTKLYLGSPYFNDVQKERVEQATEYLNRNESVGIIHFPFDHQYKGVSLVDEDKDELFGTLEWQKGTYQNDVTAMETSDAGVFLYDVENIDDGCAFEIGFMRALHKPVIIILLGEEDVSNTPLNLMISQGGTYFSSDMEELSYYDFNYFLSNEQESMDVF